MTEELKRRTSNFFPPQSSGSYNLRSPFPCPPPTKSLFDPAGLEPVSLAPLGRASGDLTPEIFSFDRLGDHWDVPHSRVPSSLSPFAPCTFLELLGVDARPVLSQSLLLTPGELTHSSPVAARIFGEPSFGPVPGLEISQRLEVLGLGFEQIETPSSIWSTPRNKRLPVWGDSLVRDGEAAAEELGNGFIAMNRPTDPRASDWSIEPLVEPLEDKKNIYAAKVHRPIFVPQAGPAVELVEQEGIRIKLRSFDRQERPSRSRDREKKDQVNDSRQRALAKEKLRERPEYSAKTQPFMEKCQLRLDKEEPLADKSGEAPRAGKAKPHNKDCSSKNTAEQGETAFILRDIVVNLGSTNVRAPRLADSSRFVLESLCLKEYPEDYCSTFYKRNRNGYMFVRELSNSLKVNTNGPRSWVTIKVQMERGEPQKLKVDVKRLPVWKPINLNQISAPRKSSRRENRRKKRHRYSR